MWTRQAQVFTVFYNLPVLYRMTFSSFTSVCVCVCVLFSGKLILSKPGLWGFSLKSVIWIYLENVGVCACTHVPCMYMHLCCGCTVKCDTELLSVLYAQNYNCFIEVTPGQYHFLKGAAAWSLHCANLGTWMSIAFIFHAVQLSNCRSSWKIS